MERALAKAKDMESNANEKLKQVEKLQQDEQKIIKTQLDEYKEKLNRRFRDSYQCSEEKWSKSHRRMLAFWIAWGLAGCIPLFFRSAATLLTIPYWFLSVFKEIGNLVYELLISPWMESFAMLRESVGSGLFFLVISMMTTVLVLGIIFYVGSWLFSIADAVREQRTDIDVTLIIILIFSMTISLTYYDLHGSEWEYTTCWMMTMLSMLTIYYWPQIFYVASERIEQISYKLKRYN